MNYHARHTREDFYASYATINRMTNGKTFREQMIY